LFLGAALALATTVAVPSALPFRIGVCAAVLLGVALELRLCLLQRPSSPRFLVLRPDGEIELRFQDSRVVVAQVRSFTLMSWLVIMQVRSELGAHSLVIPKDGLAVEQHRQLRVWLRWCVKPDV
jgi:hypothetical protein